jgi:hypothetical protein
VYVKVGVEVTVGVHVAGYTWVGVRVGRRVAVLVGAPGFGVGDI